MQDGPLGFSFSGCRCLAKNCPEVCARRLSMALRRAFWHLRRRSRSRTHDPTSCWFYSTRFASWIFVPAAARRGHQTLMHLRNAAPCYRGVSPHRSADQAAPLPRLLLLPRLFHDVGGRGAAYDLAQSDVLADVVTRANAQGKILGSVCHGAFGLVSAKGIDGELLVKGRRVTGVTDDQINTFGIAITPKHPEDELKKAGAIYECQHAWREPFAPHTTIVGNLITGQNQNSGYETAHRIPEKWPPEEI